MKKLLILPILAIIAIITTACNGKSTEISYTLAQNYFVQNDAPQQIPTTIETQAEFDSIFGMGAVMGVNGEPTKIDFNTQFAIALVLPETNQDTDIKIRSLEKQNGILYLHYTISKGEERSFYIRPFQILLVERAHLADVVLLEE